MNVEAFTLKSSLESSPRLLEESAAFVEIDGESYYRIEDSDALSPFLMNIVSGSNHWMFVASNGALTAGRRDADHALFPYCTQDKLFESARTVGSLTALWVEVEGSRQPHLWEPFKPGLKHGSIRRCLYKSLDGNRVVFEEVEPSLGLRFRYAWTTSDRFGFVRSADIANLGEGPLTVRLLDGIQNLVPHGLDENFVNLFSNLADAYKKNELLEREGMGIYYLSSIPTDRAEPSEGLRATVAWSLGIERSAVLLSSRQVDAFREGRPLRQESETRGLRCSYLIESTFTLEANATRAWTLVADVDQSAVEVEALRVSLRSPDRVRAALEDDLLASSARLRRKIALADGDQLTAHRMRDARHRSNVLFNIMRGGVFDDGYCVSLEDFRRYLGAWNPGILKRHEAELAKLGRELPRKSLVAWAEGRGDIDLKRLATEYLPLSFSRRHGDPSRPWNKFAIETQDEDGNPILAYQGNWRDIFQNWEPLAYSYPDYLLGMISRFLNASTADGYNPYKVTRHGFDWEVLNPEEPWSNIGYWGDHQIIYLLKLLEAILKHEPEGLGSLWRSEQFVYANVPYRIRGFSRIWENPRDTIDYDARAAARMAESGRFGGADDKLLLDAAGTVVRANLLEKLLVPLLAKMSNFVLDGGIWMNTQRPEWNDANNALVGYGVSVVTLCYVNRYLEFLEAALADDADDPVEMDVKLADFIEEQIGVLMEGRSSYLDGVASPEQRFALLRALGESGQRFREAVYGGELGGARRPVSIGRVRAYLSLARAYVGRSIDSNRRDDGLYHSYNLLRKRGGDGVALDRLPEMLEGQVAALSSNRLDGRQALILLEGLRASRLYRGDVDSYILYPDKSLPTFLEKNRIERGGVESSLLLTRMVERGDGRIVARDVSGEYRFCGDFRNGSDLDAALERVKGDYAGFWSDEDADAVRALFEETFSHRSFTGRSGTFFAYEGLGSVYWHMVSKLVLAIQENACKALLAGEDAFVFDGLARFYFETLNGLGFDKSPSDYGAFPIDAYSHTPKHAGAQQPGMTGQVKEDILSRWGELGIKVDRGCIHFDPCLLRVSEFLEREACFRYLDVGGVQRAVDLPVASLAFTYCQTLVVYAIGEAAGMEIEDATGKVERRSELSLNRKESVSIFSREGTIARIKVNVPGDKLLLQ